MSEMPSESSQQSEEIQQSPVGEEETTSKSLEVVSYGFDIDYIEKIFVVWYSSGRPNQVDLYQMIEKGKSGKKPTPIQLKKWIKEVFVPRAEILDLEVRRQIDKKLIGERVQMLERHAKIGEEMQDMAIKYLRDHEDDLKVGNAVRMLIEGIEIERTSKGLSGAMSTLAEKSDDEILAELQRLISNNVIDRGSVVDAEFSGFGEGT